MKIKYVWAIQEILFYSFFLIPVVLLLLKLDTALTLLLLVIGGAVGYFWGFAVGVRKGEKENLFLQFESNLDSAGMMIVPQEEVIDNDEF